MMSARVIVSAVVACASGQPHAWSARRPARSTGEHPCNSEHSVTTSPRVRRPSKSQSRATRRPALASATSSTFDQSQSLVKVSSQSFTTEARSAYTQWSVRTR